MTPIDALIPAARLMSFADCSGGPDACWPWLGGTYKLRGGYGAVHTLGSASTRQQRPAHRAMLEATLGRRLLPGMYACHTCDNPPCINPDHLYEGTAADNRRDMVERGRSRRDLTSPGGVLTASQVREIRAIHRQQRGELAARFGISTTMVSIIVHGKQWRRLLLDAEAVA